MKNTSTGQFSAKAAASALSRFKKGFAYILAFAMMLGMFAAIPQTAGALDAVTLANIIESFDHGGTGKLQATVYGNTVTVTGAVTGVLHTLELELSPDVTIGWQAAYSSDINHYPLTVGAGVWVSDLIRLTGNGTFRVETGGSIINGSKGHGIVTVGRIIEVAVDGGIVAANGEYNAIFIGGLDNTVNAATGRVEASGTGAAIHVHAGADRATVTVNAATIMNKNGNGIESYADDFRCALLKGEIYTYGIGRAIYTVKEGAIIEVTGGLISSEAEGIYAIGDETAITVRGGEITGGVGDSDGEFCRPAIYTEGAKTSITVTGGDIRSDGLISPAIWAWGEGSMVTVSGGTVSNIKSYIEGAISNSFLTAITVGVRGGFVLSLDDYYEKAITIYETGTVSIGGNAVVCTWDHDALSEEIPVYAPGSSTDLYVNEGASAVWHIVSLQTGILYTNGTNTGFFPIDGVKIEAPIPPTPTPTAPTTEFPFTDVPEGAWYYEAVRLAWELGLIGGKTPTLFMPGDNLTYAEAVKLAACMHQLYTTEAITLENATGGLPWYRTYADYALENGIISGEYDWGADATRAGYIEMFANALPDEALPAINNIPDGSIPDVPMTHPQAAAIYKLYRAGIIRGVDHAFNCNPSANIMRCEVATILVRMMYPAERVQIFI